MHITTAGCTQKWAAIGLLLASSSAMALDLKLAGTIKLGTQGVGLELTTPIIEDSLNLRAGFHAFSVDADEEGDANELDYEGELDLRSIPLLVDWHPFRGQFRTTAGLIFSNSGISASATCDSDSCEFGDESFGAETLGTTRLDVDLGGVQPYLGIGYGNAVSRSGGFSFSFDLGLQLQNVDVDIQPSSACRADPDCRAEVEREEDELKEEVEDFDIYPVVSIGVGYRFR